MTEADLSDRGWLRAIGIGLAISVLTALLMVTLSKTGVSPLPKPLGLAFAETLLGRSLPLPVGLLFHTAYVTLWSVVFVRFFPQRNIKSALLLAGALWLGVLLVFFPVVGWGLAGMNVSPRLIPASFVPHLLFGLLLWALEKYAHRNRNAVD
ncbi:MAG: hypothetical protein O7F15_11385 [Gammaproteobacteria bacterium]|nr:hypothetical protein [Gammaproteobacteria bacterium]